MPNRGDQRPPFGDLLRRARRAAGMTQEELAERAKLSARGISDLERGARRTPRADTLELLAEALNLTDEEQREWRRVSRQGVDGDDTQPVPPLQRTTLVGREHEFALLRDAVEAGITGLGGVTVLAGEPGVGKTRLSEDLAAYARGQSVRVLWGRCHEGEGAPAYWPWVQIVRDLVDSLAPDVLRRDLGRGDGAVAQLVPEINDKLPGSRLTRSSSPEQARFELFDSIARFLNSVSLRVPLLLVLDDLHWADQSSLDLLSFLGRETRGSRMVILGAYRDTEADLLPSLSQTIAELSRTPRFQHLSLTGLGNVEVGQLIERVLGRPPADEMVSAVQERTAGNPFFVDELARLMLVAERSGGRASEDVALTTIPPGAKGILEQRYRRLSPECHAMLISASVVGREFNLSILETLSGETRQQLLPSLDEALRSRLIERLGGSVGRYRFSHALVRETLYETLSSARRASLHQQAGEFLERVHAGELGPHLSMLAHHFFQAIPATDAGKAIDYALRTGERAASQFAHAEAVNHYRQALEALDLGPPAGTETRCEVLLMLGEACNHAGRYQEAQDAFTRAAEISRETGLAECLGRAAVGAAGLGVIEHGESGHLQLLEDAASALSGKETLLRSHVLARLSIVLRGPETLERRWALVGEAEAIARSLGDQPLLLYSLLARHRSLWVPSFRDKRLAVAREFTTLAEEVGGNVAVPSVPYRMYDHLEIGEIDVFDTLLQRFTENVAELRQPQRIWITTSMRVMRELMDGRLDEAERLNDQAMAIGESAAPNLAYADYFMFRFFLFREQGRIDELAGPARQVNSWYPNDIFWQALLTVLHDEAVNCARPTLPVDDLIERVERYSARDGDAVVAGVLLSDCSEVTNHLERADRIYAALAPFAGFNAIVPNSRHFHCLGSVSHSLGLLASELQQWNSAERHFEDAIEMHSRLGAAAFLAHTRYAFARMLAERGVDTDHARSLELARQARDSANALGMRVVAGQVASLIANLI